MQLPVLRFHVKLTQRLASGVRAIVTALPKKRLARKVHAADHKRPAKRSVLVRAGAAAREGSSAAFLVRLVGSLSVLCAAVAVLKKITLGIQINNMSTKPARHNPQEVFESALAILNHDSSVEASKPAKSVPLRVSFDSVRMKERALNEAAHALAELWKK